MKVHRYIGTWGLALFLCGGLMAEQLPQKWVTIKNKVNGVQADFPQRPLEMTFEIPFQNTPPKGELHLYSVPMPTGVVVLSTFTSASVNEHWLQKEQIHQFFETILVPHFFFNPAVFQDHQVFHLQPSKIKGKKGASFQISYRDHGIAKKLEGQAIVKDNQLFVYFYLASDEAFDQNILQRFLKSVELAH